MFGFFAPAEHLPFKIAFVYIQSLRLSISIRGRILLSSNSSMDLEANSRWKLKLSSVHSVKIGSKLDDCRSTLFGYMQQLAK
ncbi:uncharacterized protein L3040_000132 [Drepanopeziza brunnea f. sp. 'multigermtubi']|uniref:uncharacterized protein n=1 Tax=Drepanopeziza brunnea f. sp. 'multigermtubi' TaxID=698441 RepID=UPI0023A4D355|nr:hypothetical protein L3040_000132 [Drepanopeziza brunnea f. sp. 'multigermtubi']